MTHSEHINELSAALAKAQGEMRNPGADTTNSFQKYSYAQVDQFLDIIRGPLSKNNISFTQDVEEITMGKKTLSFMLSHSSGQWMKFTMPLDNVEASKGNSADQAWGSHLTYRKKNLISLVFGIHSDKDADGYEEPKRHQEQEKNTNQNQSQSTNQLKPKLNYEKMTSEQVQAIMFEIGEHTEIGQNLLKNFGVDKVSDLPKEYYLKIIDRIRTNVKAKKERE